MNKCKGCSYWVINRCSLTTCIRKSGKVNRGERRERMTELKPCPFCGSKKVRMYSERDNSVHGFIHICEGFDEPMVKVESRLFATEEEAIEAWNRRTEPPIDLNLDVNGFSDYAEFE